MRRIVGAVFGLLACGCRPPELEQRRRGDLARADLSSNPGYRGEEFVGPFARWIDVRADHGARGDGVADDTSALQAALDEAGATAEGRHVVFLPAGRHRISRTLDWRARIGVGLLGEQPDATVIVWDDPTGGTMMLADGVAYSRWGRLTWDGAQRAARGVVHQWNHQTTPL